MARIYTDEIFTNMVKNRTWILLIVLELILGVIVGLAFNKIILNCDNFFGKSYFSGIFRYYGLNSLIFFITVFLIGIIGAIKQKRNKNIKKAIIYAIFFWTISLFVYSSTFSFFSYGLNWRLIPIFIILIGIVVGFNIGIGSKTDKVFK